MFVRLMELIEKNSGKLASNILGDVRRREEARRKGGFAPGPDDGGDPGKGSAIYEDLLEWLFDNLQKENLISYYSSLGEQTHLRGARLEEIVTAILVIQKEIMTLIIDEIDGGGDFFLREILDIVFRVNLFFDLVMHSVINGFHREPGPAVFEGGSEKGVMSTLFLG
jgi:hypothetical protein